MKFSAVEVPGAPSAPSSPGAPVFFSQCTLENRRVSSEEKKISRVQSGGADQCEKACSDHGTECVGWTWSSGDCDLFNSLLMEQYLKITNDVISGIMNFGDCPTWAKITTKGRFIDT